MKAVASPRCAYSVVLPVMSANSTVTCVVEGFTRSATIVRQNTPVLRESKRAQTSSFRSPGLRAGSGPEGRCSSRRRSRAHRSAARRHGGCSRASRCLTCSQSSTHSCAMPERREPTAEKRRLLEDGNREQNWKRWGPYLSERQWGTVREDYSADGDCWDYFPHDHARSRAYRWGEDGLLGICDRECRLCFALALWNGRDPILKERLFGLTGPEGNHGEDVKECYFYLDATPTHSYMKALYKYPQAEFPYARLVEENRRRGQRRARVRARRHRRLRRRAATSTSSPSTPRRRPTTSSSASRSPTAARRRRRCTCCRRSGSATPGRGAATARATGRKPRIAPVARPAIVAPSTRRSAASGSTPSRARRRRARAALHRERDERRSGCSARRTPTPYVKDAFHDYVVQRPARTRSTRRATGTKAAAHYRARRSRPAARSSLRLRLHAEDERAATPPFGPTFDARLRAAHRARPTSSTPRASPAELDAEERAGGAPGVRRAALVASSSTTTSSRTGSRATRRSRRRPPDAHARPQRATGRTSTTATSSRCRTSGSTRGTPRGTSRST